MTTNYMQGILREYQNSVSPKILGTLRQEGHRPSKKKNPQCLEKDRTINFKNK